MGTGLSNVKRIVFRYQIDADGENMTLVVICASRLAEAASESEQINGDGADTVLLRSTVVRHAIDTGMHLTSFIQNERSEVKAIKYSNEVTLKAIFTPNAMGTTNPEVSVRGGF